MKALYIVLMSLSVLPLYGKAAEKRVGLPKMYSPSFRENKANKKASIDRLELYFGNPLFCAIKRKKGRPIFQSKIIHPFHQKRYYYLEGALSIPLIQSQLTGSYTCLNIQNQQLKNRPASLKKGDAQKIEYCAKVLALSRTSLLTSFLGIRTLLGEKWTKIEEEHNSEHSQIGKEKASYAFKGTGPILGLNLNWSFFGCLSLVAKGNGALLIGKFQNKRQMNAPSFSGSPLFFAPNLSLLIGLNWNVRLGDIKGILGLDCRKESFRGFEKCLKIKDPFKSCFSIPLIQCVDPLSFWTLNLRIGLKF